MRQRIDPFGISFSYRIERLIMGKVDKTAPQLTVTKCVETAVSSRSRNIVLDSKNGNSK